MAFNENGQTTNCGKAEAHEPHVKRFGHFVLGGGNKFYEDKSRRIECDGALWYPVSDS